VSTTTTDPILAAYFLKYDQSNRVTSFASRFDGFSTAYGYDTRDQLTGATTTPLAGATVTFTPPVENYVFDKTGNRTNGGTSTSANETHNRVQNDGTNTYLYDNEGNQISRTNNSTGEVTTYSYDYRNRLIKVASPGKVVSYQYDAFDRRIRKLVDDGGNGSIDSRTAWVWDGNQVIFQFKDSDGEGILPFKLTNRYLYGDIVDLILADEQVGVPGTGGGSVGMPMSFPIGSTGSVSTEGLYRILWPLSDHLGTVRDLVDSNGTRLEHRVYDSFGKLLVETEDFTSGNTGSTGGSLGMPVGGGGGGGTTTDAIDSIFGYTGREWDKDVKLQFNRARWYDPASGRWISQDPIGFRAGDANLYRYVGNRPTTYTDPSGLRGWEIGGLTPGQWTYATGVLFYEWGANGCRAVHGIASGSAGRSMGERAVAMSQNQSGQQFDGDAGDWLRFSNQMAREMTGANAIAEGGVGVDMAEYRELDAWERGTRISSGTGAMAGTAAGGLGLAGKAGIGIGNVKVPFTPNMPSFPLPPWMRPTNGSTSGATLGEIASVSEDALVNIGSQARDIVLPPGGRSYWFRFGDIKHLTIDQVRTLVGQMASAGTREGSRVIRVAKKGTEGKSVPCTDGYFEYVIDGAVDVSESISLP
jgi:RHS repeat-associated protein